jgi:tyrosyl-tRNA synthetase
MFGKIMSLSDEIMWRYFELLSFKPLSQIQFYKDAIEKEGANPRDIKFELGMEIVERFHDSDSAEKAKQDFLQRFQKGQLPDEVADYVLQPAGAPWMLGSALKESGLVTSTSEAIRMIKQGAVKIDGEKVLDKKMVLELSKPVVLQVGKRKVIRVSLGD